MQHGSTVQCLVVEEEGDRLNVATKTKKPDEPLPSPCTREARSPNHSRDTEARSLTKLTLVPPLATGTVHPSVHPTHPHTLQSCY